ncbi:MAG: hypothetical protein IJZ58_05405 [Oscillospiraceae bacterium]|nr:hypothetical protein [Oscillospiraceae bacterium]
MNRRRMMMSGKPRPLFIFKPGEKLQNYSGIQRKRNVENEEWRSADSYILYKPSGDDPQKLFLERGISNPNESTRPVIRIAIPLKKAYTKLFVAARSPDSGGEPNAEAFNSYISWSTAADGFFYDKTLLQDKEETFEFDISKRDKNSETFYLFFQHAQLMGDITISDIHFE